MRLVSNTGPLIALAKLDRLALLRDMAPEGVLIPPVIQWELRAKIGTESVALDAALTHSDVLLEQVRKLADE